MDTSQNSASSPDSAHARDRYCALEIATQSLLDSHVAGAGLASVLADRTLDHVWDGVFQHLALRAGPAQACELLSALESERERDAESDLAGSAGPRASLYRHIRRLVRCVPPLTPTSLHTTAWWRAPDARYAARLHALRHALVRTFSATRLEAIELRFARSLSPHEIAAVLDAGLDEIEAVSAQALALAERHVGRRPASHDRTPAGALLEALALDAQYVFAPRRRKRRPVLAIGALIAGRYEVEALLGAGAFADVYRARDREVRDHVVALKILRVPCVEPSSERAAMRELQLIASVFHPSIVQLKDHGWHGGHLWFVMPLYRGETLAARVARGPLGRSEARAIFEPLAEGLAAMHRAGVLHQDIKPDNVFLATLDPCADDGAATSMRTGQRILPVLLDLGVAARDAELVLAGTPAYFAPEVAARFAGAPDPAPVGPKADVFALALTLRHALDPRPLPEVAGGSVDAFVAYRALHAPEPPSGSDLHDLRPAFARWLSFSPDGRPAADELRNELAVLTRPQERRARRLSLLRWAVPIAVTLVALFSAVIYGLSREASIQRLEAASARARAEQAGERAARVSASLNAQQARRRELEADVARLQSEYQNSRMTREQLAERLAQTEGQLVALTEKQKQQSDELRKQREQREEAQDELGTARAARDDLHAKLQAAHGALDGERTRREELEHEVHALREQLDGARVEADQAEARARALATRWAVWRLVDAEPGSTRAAATNAKTSTREHDAH